MELLIIAAVTIAVILGLAIFRAFYDLVHTREQSQKDSLSIRAKQAKARVLLLGILSAVIGAPLTLVMATFATDAGPNLFATLLFYTIPIFLIVPFIPQFLYAIKRYPETLTVSRYVLMAPWCAILTVVALNLLFGWFW